MEKDILENCISRWGKKDDRIKYFSDNYDKYMGSLSPEMKEIIDNLLDHFDYYSHNEINKHLTKLHKKIMEIDDLDIDNSVFCVLKSQRCTINSSYEYLIEYRHLNDLSKYSIIPEMSDLVKGRYWDNIKNVIFIDDFCGSGKTFIDYIKNNIEYISHKNIIYAVIHIMESAIKAIEEYAEKNNLSILVVYENIKCAAFNISEELREKKENFQIESEAMDLHGDNDIFGFKKTEALLAFFNNTPNNTLGVFWKQTSKNNPLFPREQDTRPGWMKLKQEKKQRKESNYLRMLPNDE